MVDVRAARRAVKVAPEAFDCDVVRLGAPQETKLFGMGHPETIEQHMLGHGENDSVRADAQCKRGYGNRCQPRALGQHPHGIAQVAVQLVEDARAPRRPAVLLPRRNAAQLGPRPAHGFVARKTAADQVLGIALNVELQFLADLPIQLPASADSSPPCRNAAQQPHISSGFTLRIDPIRSTNWFHFLASASSRRRPAAVSL